MGRCVRPFTLLCAAESAGQQWRCGVENIGVRKHGLVRRKALEGPFHYVEGGENVWSKSCILLRSVSKKMCSSTISVTTCRGLLGGGSETQSLTLGSAEPLTPWLGRYRWAEQSMRLRHITRLHSEIITQCLVCRWTFDA